MEQLKVLLMKPYSPADELIPPFSLGYLAAAIRENHQVEIVDGIKEKLDLPKFEDWFKNKNYDVIGLQIFTFQVPAAKKYVAVIKKYQPNAKVIFGGPHPSCSPNSIFDDFPRVDFAFRGEAEVGFPQLLGAITSGNLTEENLSGIPGLIWRRSGKAVSNPPIFTADLDKLGIPSWDLIKPDTYPLAPHGGFFKNYPVAPIIITRGCPFSCTYCAGHLVTGKKVRYRSIDKVMEEIRLLYEKYGIREIHIEDDNFTFDNQYVIDFCGRLIKSRMNISWTCPNGVRLDSLSRELLLKMKEAGLYSLSVGVESGSDKILKDMKKNLDTEKIKERIQLIKNCGLEVSGFFIIGYPTETIEDIEKTIKFSQDLELKRAGFSLFKPFPGTEITKNLIASKQLFETSDEDWSRFILADAIYAPPGLTKEQMKKMRKKALWHFYRRPKIIYKFIREIKNFTHLKLIIKRAYSWLWGAK